MTCYYCGSPTSMESMVHGELRPICYRPCMHILWAEQTGLRVDAPQKRPYIDQPVTVTPGWDVITDRLAAWTERQAEAARRARSAPCWPRSAMPRRTCGRRKNCGMGN